MGGEENWRTPKIQKEEKNASKHWTLEVTITATPLSPCSEILNQQLYYMMKLVKHSKRLLLLPVHSVSLIMINLL